MYITSGQANRPRSIYQILTWFRGFQDKLLYLVWFSLREQRNLKKITILTRKLQGHVRIVIYRKRPIKCHCQRKPGRIKRSRSAVYLHLFTV